MYRFVVLFLLSLLFISCGIVDTKEPRETLEIGQPYIIYNGIVSNNGSSQASFTMVNDSTETIQYFAYTPAEPHYSAEVLTDSGWVYLFWNWCGTGAEYFSLESDSSFEFTTNLPYESCTWRVMINVSDQEGTNTYFVRSEGLEYMAP